MLERPPYRSLVVDSNSKTQLQMNQWSPLKRELVMIVALVLAIAALVHFNGAMVLANGLLALLLAGFWHSVFARARGHKPGLDLVSTGLLFCLMLPTGFETWQLVLGISFGIVVGEQLYGGRGFSFLHPVIAGLAFLLNAFPETGSSINHPMLSAFMLPGTFLLLLYRLIDWRTLASLVIGLLLMHFILLQALPQTWPGSMIVAGLLFCVLDPAVATSTRTGRWFYGLLVGALVVLFDPAMYSLHAVVFASLIGSITAPLIDWLVVEATTRRVSNRHA